MASKNTDSASLLAKKHLQQYCRRQPALSAHSLETLCGHRSRDAIVETWLEALLAHFSLQAIEAMSEQELVSTLSELNVIAKEDSTPTLTKRGVLLAELKHRIIRLAGAELTCSFVSMSPDVVDEGATTPIHLSIESHTLTGIRYQGEVYRLVKTYLPCHRLQAFCQAQSLARKAQSYVITRSSDRFAVWINVKALSGCVNVSQ